MNAAGGRANDERPPAYRSPRRIQEPKPSARTETQRDRDRILYSSAFGRLAGITQVASSAPGASFHNRLTHSFKVAQVARRLAERLKVEEQGGELVDKLDVDATEAAALGHDWAIRHSVTSPKRSSPSSCRTLAASKATPKAFASSTGWRCAIPSTPG